jgi:hypothetical protein
MVAFWEGFADRRFLQQVIWSKQDAIVLPRRDLEVRLLLAFGVPVDLDLMVASGFLERTADDDVFRVTGVSRQLNTERARLAKKYGATLMPPGMAPPAPPPQRAQKPVPPGVVPPVPPPVRPRVAPPVVPPQRSEDRGKRKKKGRELLLPNAGARAGDLQPEAPRTRRTRATSSSAQRRHGASSPPSAPTAACRSSAWARWSGAPGMSR